MIHRPAVVGDRVRLIAPSPVLTLPSRLGLVVDVDRRFPDYLLVRLDEPATYTDVIGRTVSLTVIREAPRNLEVTS